VGHTQIGGQCEEARCLLWRSAVRVLRRTRPLDRRPWPLGGSRALRLAWLEQFTSASPCLSLLPERRQHHTYHFRTQGDCPWIEVLSV